MPVIDRLADEFKGRARIVIVEADREGKVLESFDVSSVPAYLLFRDGVQIDRFSLNAVTWFFEPRIRRMLAGAID